MPGAATVAPEPSQEPSADAGAATPPPPKLSADDALNSKVPDHLMLGLTYLGAAKFCLEELKLIKEFVVLDRDRENAIANDLMRKAPGGSSRVAKFAMAAGNGLNAALGNTGGPKDLPNGGRWPTGVPLMTRQTLILSQFCGNWKSVGHVRSLLNDKELPPESTPLNMRKFPPYGKKVYVKLGDRKQALASVKEYDAEKALYTVEFEASELQKFDELNGQSQICSDKDLREPLPYHEDLTVYDLIAHVKKWLKTHGKGEESVVEVLRRKGWGKEYLGPAKVFYSHSQAEHPAEMMAGLCAAAFEVAGIGDTSKPGAKWNSVPVWIDAFSLRQAAEKREDRWDSLQIEALIKKIGCTVATVDNTRRFLGRSMCIMETFVTIDNGGQLLIRPALNDWMPDIFEAEHTDENRMDMGTHSIGPLVKGLADSSPAFPCCCLAYWLAPQVKVNAEYAQSSDYEDEDMVNRWIKERSSFKFVNQTMEREMRKQQGMLGLNRAILCLNASLICCCIPSPCLCLLSCQSCLPNWYKKLCVPMIV